MTAIEEPPVEATTAPVRRKRLRQSLRIVASRPLSAAALGFILLCAVVAIAAPLVAPHDPSAQDLDQGLTGPAWDHLLGTDEFGRDVLSRIIYGARIALMAPIVSIIAAIAIGVPIGLWSGLRRGKVDAIAGRLADTLLSLPGIVIALAIIAVVGPGLVNVMLAVGILFSPTLFRIVRGATMAVAEETFIESARAVGSSSTRTIWVHVLPNIAAPLMVQITLLMGLSLLIEASLSFLGIGVLPPTPSWGAMLRDAYENQYQAPYSALPSGIAICVLVLSFNIVGDSIRDSLTSRRRR